MSKGLILLDLDKTLIGTNFACTDSGIFDAVNKLQAEGWTIGLNSDRALINLRRHKEMFGLNGPLICELGNIVDLGNSAEPFWTQPELRIRFAKLTSSLLQHLCAKYPDTLTIVGDNELAKKLLTRLIAGITLPLVLFNGLRQASLAFNAIHFRAHTIQNIHPAPELLRALAEEAATMFCSIFNCESNCYVDDQVYNSCMLHHPDSSKTRGAAALLESHDYSRVFMIGDSAFDHLQIDGVLHCAVGNASAEFKPLCQFVAPHTLTSGVIDCLEWIHQNF